MCSCGHSHSNKLESLFECEVSRLLYNEGEVEYWLYEPVDYTEQSATRGATGAVMQGALLYHSISFAVQCANLLSHFLQGIPANPKRDHQWVKRKSTKTVFCQLLFDAMPRFFTHHQIDLAQRDGKKILLSMILRDSGILNIDFDFLENYTHTNQECSVHLFFALNCF